MRLKKYLASFLIGTIIATSFTACTLPKLQNDNTEEVAISYKPFNNKASSPKEIAFYINDAINNNMSKCEIFVPDENLIDTAPLLPMIDSAETLHATFRKVKNGFNVVYTYDLWDYHSIIQAYNKKDTSVLNDRQLKMYNKYLEILSEVTSPDYSDYENELAIHDYLVENITYVETEDRSLNAYNALFNGQAMCGGYTECFKTLMDMIGIENYTISGFAGGENHIWNVVKLEDQWYQVDVTWDDPKNSSFNFVNHGYFNVTQSDMELDHQWDKEYYSDRIANGTKYSYNNQESIRSISNQSELKNYIYSIIHNKSPFIEFTATIDNLDLKSAISAAGVQCSYTYKTLKRNDYILYSINFNY